MGALLVTAPKVIHEDFNEGFNKPYKMWVKENFDTLLSHGENEMRRYGLWIIMETYSTQACMIQTWTGKTREVKLALEANAIMAGQLGPSIEWSRNRNSEDLSAYIGEGYGGRVVVFCNGLRYRFARRWEGVKRQVRSAIIFLVSYNLNSDDSLTQRKIFIQGCQDWTIWKRRSI